MVSTRSQSHHPSNPTTSSSPSPPTPPPPTPAPHHYPRTWSHTPSNLTLLWLLISLPLVFWDASYVLLRPHSMPGGFLHSPLWTPYALYGAVDYIYGWPAYEARNGFTAAQTALNVVECLLYGFYLWVVYRHGRGETGEGRGAPGSGKVGWVGRGKVVRGRWGGWAVVVGFGAAVMTVSKTVLYWLNEHFSGYVNIGHNDFRRLLVLWIVPNGAWLVLPTYMIYVFGREILQGLAIASSDTSGSDDDTVSRKER